jgi:hypothetical protein
VIEIALSLKGLGPRVSFNVIVSREVNGARVDVERHPPSSTISFEIPTAAFSSINWRA